MQYRLINVIRQFMPDQTTIDIRRMHMMTSNAHYSWTERESFCHIPPPVLHEKYLTELEWSDLAISDFPSDGVSLPDAPEERDLRWPSLHGCTDRGISLEELSRFLSRSYGAAQGSKRRPYASAGALYPVSVLIAAPNIFATEDVRSQALPEGVYHYRPHTHRLEKLVDRSYAEALDLIMGTQVSEFGSPAFFVAYVMYFEKSAIKYGTRAYRLMLIETGAMLQRAAMVGQDLGLSSRPWFGFSDFELGAMLGLDPRSVVPVITHLFGYPRASDDS